MPTDPLERADERQTEESEKERQEKLERENEKDRMAWELRKIGKEGKIDRDTRRDKEIDRHGNKKR